MGGNDRANLKDGSRVSSDSDVMIRLSHVGKVYRLGEIDLYGRTTSVLEVGAGFHGEMTGHENAYLNGAILGMKKKEIDAVLDQIVEFSEVGEFIDTPVKRYSSGMYVRLAFAVGARLRAGSRREQPRGRGRRIPCLKKERRRCIKSYITFA